MLLDLFHICEKCFCYLYGNIEEWKDKANWCLIKITQVSTGIGKAKCNREVGNQKEYKFHFGGNLTKLVMAMCSWGGKRWNPARFAQFLTGMTQQLLIPFIELWMPAYLFVYLVLVEGRSTRGGLKKIESLLLGMLHLKGIFLFACFLHTQRVSKNIHTF